jgi:hypothetical protein
MDKNKRKKLEKLLNSLSSQEEATTYNLQNIIDRLDELIQETTKLKKPDFSDIIIIIDNIRNILEKISSSEKKNDFDLIVQYLKIIKDNLIFLKEKPYPSNEQIENTLENIHRAIIDLKNSVKEIKPIVAAGGAYKYVGLENINNIKINPATEETLQKSLGLSGAGVDTAFTLTNANTSYAIPTSPPVDFYTLVIYNSSDTDIYLRFTSGITAGIKIASGASFAIDLGGGQQVYVYCGVANKTINLSYKII